MQDRRGFFRDTWWVLPAVSVLSAFLAYRFTPFFLLYIPLVGVVLLWMGFVRNQGE